MPPRIRFRAADLPLITCQVVRNNLAVEVFDLAGGVLESSQHVYDNIRQEDAVNEDVVVAPVDVRFVIEGESRRQHYSAVQQQQDDEDVPVPNKRPVRIDDEPARFFLIL